MKSNSFKRLAATLAAGAMMAAATPCIPAVFTGAAENIISNSTFETGTSGWDIYTESGGTATLNSDGGRLALKISDVGTVNYAVQAFYDSVPLYKDGVYRFSYDISSTTNRLVECMIQQNGGTYQPYTWKGINVTSTPQTVQYEFTMTYDTDMAAKLAFNCGIQEADGALPEHTIYIDNVSLERVDGNSSSSNNNNNQQQTSGNIVWGDADCDGNVKMNDSVLVMQVLSNSDIFGENGSDPSHIKPQGAINADVYNNGDKLTPMDALSIQKHLLGIVKTLPESYMEGQPIVVTTTTTTTTAPVITTTTTSTPINNNNSIPDKGTPMNSNAQLVADFRKGQPSSFIASDGWSNASVFNCFWHKENTSYKDGVLNLTIDQKRSDSKYPDSAKYPYSAAEYRTNDFYGFGYYETSMQAIKNDGVVSSFFTYTGESDNNPWDEIDIEILGKDTTKVQFNYYTNSKGDHEFMYDLGFDASEAFHTYGFDWQPDHITWYVDGKAVYTANQNIPQTPGKIMMNVWPGIGVDSWLKAFNGRTPLTARYQWVTFNPSQSNNNNQNNNNNNQNNNNQNNNQSNLPFPDKGTPMKSNSTLVADFRKGQPSSFIASDGWSNASVFNCFWHKENTSYKDGVLNLTIDQKRSDSKYPDSAKYPYSAAEYRTNNFYGFGYYETSMQAIKNDGVVSSFFTYTGESDNNPWDEIDIEILGKDTTKVQFNYYTNSKGDHEFMYDLGFDASEAFHTYGFDWQPDHITWYVDGRAVYTAYQNIPQTPGKIMMNVWPGIGVDDWLKAFNGRTPLTARYQWVTYNKQ